MGNTQGVVHGPLAGAEAHWTKQHAPLPIMAPPAAPVDSNASAPAVANKIKRVARGRGGRKGGSVAVRRTITEETIDTTKQHQLVLAEYSKELREAHERAVKAEAGRMSASMKGGEWQAKYEEAAKQINELEQKAKADEKRMGILKQCLASLKKKLAFERGERRREKRAKTSLSQSSLSSSGPPLKRRRPRESTSEHSTSNESLRSLLSEWPRQTVPITQYTEVVDQREKLEWDCGRLRAVLARFGVDDEAEYEDVKPDIKPLVAVPPVPPMPLELVEQLKNSEDANRELREMLDWYKTRLAEVSADFERLSVVVASRQLLPPVSPLSMPPPTPNKTEYFEF